MILQQKLILKKNETLQNDLSIVCRLSERCSLDTHGNNIISDIRNMHLIAYKKKKPLIAISVTFVRIVTPPIYRIFIRSYPTFSLPSVVFFPPYLPLSPPLFNPFYPALAANVGRCRLLLLALYAARVLSPLNDRRVFIRGKRRVL